MTPHIRPGRIVEFGCGSGFVVEFLSERFPDSIIVGIDRATDRLKVLAQKAIPNVIPLGAEITQVPFPDAVFNTALFVGSLHEIYSNLGMKKVLASMKLARDVVDAQGAIIIQDFLRPAPRIVEMYFRNEQTRAKFMRFAREFRPRKVIFETLADGVRLDVADAAEFLSKYRSPTEEDWRDEMEETHFALAETDYPELAKAASLQVLGLERLPPGQARLSEMRQDVDFAFAPEYSWIQVVLQKNGT